MWPRGPEERMPPHPLRQILKSVEMCGLLSPITTHGYLIGSVTSQSKRQGIDTSLLPGGEKEHRAIKNERSRGKGSGGARPGADAGRGREM